MISPSRLVEVTTRIPVARAPGFPHGILSASPADLPKEAPSASAGNTGRLFNQPPRDRSSPPPAYPSLALRAFLTGYCPCPS